jgi:hypothetical protein
VEANIQNQQTLSDGWFKYFGFRLLADEIICDGCMTNDPNLIDKNCPVRPCVIEKRLENCSQCDEYVCEKLTERIVEYKEIRKRIGEELSKDDYVHFIRPYENKRRLDEIRCS